MPRDPLPDWTIDRRRALGERIAYHRLRANLAQQAVIDATGIPHRTYQRIERGTSDPRYSDLLLIAAALDVTLADLVSE